jgi:hypothetical protein
MQAIAKFSFLNQFYTLICNSSPTDDQVFGEAQFESYRRLGHDIGSELFKLATMNGDMVAYADALQRRIQSPGAPSGKRVSPDIARPAHRIHAFHLVRGGRHTP